MSHALTIGEQEQTAIISSKCRADLQWHPIDQHESPDLIKNARSGRWVVQDPFNGKYVHIGAEEKFLLRQLDGRQTIESLQQAFRQQFPPKSIKPQEIFQLLAFARQHGFLVEARPWSDYQTRMTHVWARRMEQIMAMPTQFLFCRWSLFNPERILIHFESIAPWLFHATAIRFWMSIFAAVIFGLLTQWQSVLAAIPTWEQILSPQLFLGMGITFLLLKLIHELGHGLACHYFGARCSNAGIFFMMGMICPYVDVTDSCRLPRRRERIMVTLAGMYVEWIVASIAATVWFLTQPGWLHSCCWQITVVASISTFLFNANPLLRYDGYFALSEWLAVANLKERANRHLKHVATRLLFGSSGSPVHIPITRRIAYSTFALLSGSYRFCLLAILSVGVGRIAERYEMSWLGIVAISSLFATALVMPIVRAVAWSIREMKQGRLHPTRTLLSWIALTVLFILIIVIPIPQRRQFHGKLLPADETPVYAQMDGILNAPFDDLQFESKVARIAFTDSRTELFEARPLESGEVVSCIHNLALELEVLKDRARVENYKSQLRVAQRMAFSRPLASEEIPKLESALAGANDRLQHTERRHQATTVKAERPGVFLPAPAPAFKTMASERRSPGPSHAWVSRECRGAKIQAGTILGWIRNDDRWLVRAQIREPDLPTVAVGQSARIQLRQLPGAILKGRVARVAFQPMNDPLHESQSTWDSQVIENTGEPVIPTYFIEISIESLPEACRLIRGGDADVVLHSHARSIYQLVTLWLKQNWRF